MTDKTDTKPTPRFDSMMAYLIEHKATEDDQALISLFERHRERVAQHFESCVPDGQKWMKWSPSVCSRAEMHGPAFHKGFRQMDVTDSSADDVQIWRLLAYGDTRFWDAHAESMKDKPKQSAGGN